MQIPAPPVAAYAFTALGAAVDGASLFRLLPDVSGWVATVQAIADSAALPFGSRLPLPGTIRDARVQRTARSAEVEGTKGVRLRSKRERECDRVLVGEDAIRDRHENFFSAVLALEVLPKPNQNYWTNSVLY